MNAILLNGTRTELPAGWRIADLLLDLGYRSRRVAVECNGVIVARRAYETTRLAAGDRIEIVIAVGGG
ncbi:sulfur carrier protein ThiS [Plasticicumulans acidivorans]|uniref:Sulfur carrier protein ThiS n=1 Tax=Plasticicumulans acidivorans TaxID=886464 RepID=A0A317MRU0_9GAMM|nr:sulfur carrier protein ThiS [Plasticicumulans acidivorans]PWV59090.1 sulfur carrier protein ThiS [Plasticicumulans acidivorans]